MHGCDYVWKVTVKSRQQTAVCLFKTFAPSPTHFAVGRKTACRLVFREPETETGIRSAALKPWCILAWRHRVPRASACDANAAVTGHRYLMSWSGCNFHRLRMWGFCCTHKRSPRDSALEMLKMEREEATSLPFFLCHIQKIIIIIRFKSSVDTLNSRLIVPQWRHIPVLTPSQSTFWIRLLHKGVAVKISFRCAALSRQKSAIAHALSCKLSV